MHGRKQERSAFGLAGAAGLAASVWIWASGFGGGRPLGEWLLLLLVASVNAAVAILPALFLSVVAREVWRRTSSRPGLLRVMTGLVVSLATAALSAVVGAVAGFLACWLICSLPLPFPPDDTLGAVAFVAGGLSGFLSGGIATVGLIILAASEISG